MHDAGVSFDYNKELMSHDDILRHELIKRG